MGTFAREKLNECSGVSAVYTELMFFTVVAVSLYSNKPDTMS